MNNARRTHAGDGLQTAAIALGGYIANNSALTELYDGSTWSTSANMATARRYLAGCGTTTAGLGFGGYAPGGKSNATEEFTNTFNGTVTLTTS